MLTIALVSLGVGAALGGTIGFKIGRGYERVRKPLKKKRKK